MRNNRSQRMSYSLSETQFRFGNNIKTKQNIKDDKNILTIKSKIQIRKEIAQKNQKKVYTNYFKWFQQTYGNKTFRELEQISNKQETEGRRRSFKKTKTISHSAKKPKINSISFDPNQKKLTNYFTLNRMSEANTGKQQQISTRLNSNEQIVAIQNQIQQFIKTKKYQYQEQSISDTVKRQRQQLISNIKTLWKQKMKDQINQINYNNNVHDHVISKLPELKQMERDVRSSFQTDAGTVKIEQDKLVFAESQTFIKLKQNLQTVIKKKQYYAEKKKISRDGKQNKTQTEQQQMMRYQIQIKYQTLKNEYTRLCKQKQQLMKNKKLINSQKECILQKLNWKINSEIMPFLLIGKGGFSQVYKCYDMERLKFVALKISFPNHPSTEIQKKFVKYLSRQFTHQCGLSHENIAQVYQKINFDNQTIFACTLEYCTGPELHEYYTSKQCLKQAEAKDIIRQILKGLSYMHSNGIIHYDLKPRNIMFHEGVIKIVDFGLSKQMDGEDTHMALSTAGAGTLFYLPPESSQANSKISPKVDIFSLGVIFYQLLFGYRPFGNKRKQAQAALMIQNPKTCKVTFPTQSKYPISDQAKSFIKKLLAYHAKDRYSAQQALESNYMKKNYL